MLVLGGGGVVGEPMTQQFCRPFESFDFCLAFLGSDDDTALRDEVQATIP